LGVEAAAQRDERRSHIEHIFKVGWMEIEGCG